MTDTQVVVVGAGPVGLAVAIELGRRNVPTIVFEKRAAAAEKPPTANHIGVRVMEILRRWGIADTVRAASFSPDHRDDRYWMTRIGGQVLRRIPRPPNGQPAPPPHSPEGELWSPKHDFDPQLEALAATFPSVQVRYEHRVESVRQSVSEVSLGIESAGAAAEVRAPWVVGCDGANSDVRRAVGAVRAGFAELPIVLQSVDFRSAALKRLLPAGGTQYFLVDPNATIVAIDPVDRFRIHFPTDADVVLAPAEAAARIDAVVGAQVGAEVRSVLPWRLRQSLTDRWRVGRVLLAGDAAKQATPYGGLGMNYGIVDAATLGWMLAGVCERWAGSALLDAYAHERRASAERFLAYQGLDLTGAEPRSDNPFVVGPVPAGLHDDGPAGDAARAAYAERLAAADAAHFDNAGVDTDQRCPDSPAVVPDGSAEPPWSATCHVDAVRPGHRFPHRWLAPGRSTLDLFDRAFVVLAEDAEVAQPLAEALMARGAPVEVRVVAPGVVGRPAALVRPDGISAWCGSSAREPAAIAALVTGAG